MDKYFPIEDGTEIIAEPGTFLVASAFTLGVNIIGKKVVTVLEPGKCKYYDYRTSKLYCTAFLSENDLKSRGLSILLLMSFLLALECIIVVFA